MSGFASDIPITFTTKGISPVTLATAYGDHLKTGRTNGDTNPIVNYWQLSGSRTNEGVMMYALGSDTNISAYYYAKGTGGHIFNTNGTNVAQFSVAHTASAVNYLQATGAPTFNSPSLSARGTNSDISILLAPKGIGTVVVAGNGGIQLNGSTSGWVGFQSPAIAGAITYTLPSGDGTNGQVLSTNGSATLSWATAATNTGPAFSAYLATSGGSIANVTFTKILFDTEIWDTNSNFASSRFTPTVAGYYQINASYQISGTAPAFISIMKNGNEYKRGVWNTANTQDMTVSGVVSVNGSTDYIEIYLYQGSGGAVTPQGGSTISWFDGTLVRAA
jgi:hypothetical protein